MTSLQPTSADVELRWTRPGRPLARAVGDAIRALQDDDPLRAVRVVAPDGATVDGLRRALPLDGGSCGAEIGGTLRLANELAAPGLGDRRAAPEVAVLAVVQQVLADARTRPAAFDSCADHPATHDAIVRAARSLEGAFTLPGGPLAAARALAGLAEGRASAGAVVEVVATVRERLVRQGLVDRAEIVRIATQRLLDDATVGTDPVVLVVTQQFNPAHVALLRALIERAPRTIVVATTARTAAVSVAAHVSRLVGREVTEPDEAPQDPASTRTVALVSCPDHDEEVREVTRRIVDLLERGVVADRIGVFFPAAGPHRGAIAASLAAAGIAARGQVAPPLKGSIAGQVLRLLTTVATDGLDRRLLVELARVAPFGLDTTIDDDGTVVEHTRARRGDRWDLLARTHGVVGERDWPAFDAARPDDPAHRDHAAHRSLTHFVRQQRRQRDRLRGASSWREAAAALEAWFATHCGTVEWRLDTWVGVPAWQHEAAEQVEGVFGVLAEVDGFGLPYRVRTLVRLVTAFLDTDTVTAESRGAGVFVDQVVGAPGAVVDHAFVLGANDHLLPGRVGDDLVLTRAHGAEPLGVLTGPSNRPLRDERGFLAALDGATESVTITWSRWDLRAGGALYESPLVTAAARSAESHREHVASHAARVQAPGTAWLDADEWFVRDLARTTPRLSRRRRAITARAQARPGEYDGQVGPLGSVDPFTRVDAEGRRREVGITSLEQWVNCGIEYFVTRVLEAPTDDTDPSTITDVEPLEKGTLVHAVFERLVTGWLAAHPGSTEAWIPDEAHVDALLERAGELFDELAEPLLAAHRLGHPEMWRARRAQMLRALRRGLVAELGEGSTPVAAEFAFGRRSDGTRAAAVWTSPDSEHEVHFSGSIDRIDRLRDGSLRVMDLKTGRSTDYRSITYPLSPLGPDGNRLQLAFYGWAVGQLLGEPVGRALYRFVGRPEHDDDVVITLDESVQEQLDLRLNEIVDAIRHGRFEPGEVGTWGCPVCAPDGLGSDEVNQRRLEWRGEFDDDDPAPEPSPPLEWQDQP